MSPDYIHNRPRLSEILNGGADALRDQWDEVDAASDFKPLPPGTYDVRVVGGELFTTRNHTPGYKITLKVVDGDHAGRMVWHDLFLTPAAIPYTKRDLAKLGIHDVEQLDDPLPPGIRCRVKVALNRDDDGNEFNKVKTFDVIGIDDDPTADPDFAPADDDGEGDTAEAVNAEGGEA